MINNSINNIVSTNRYFKEYLLP